MVKAKTKNYENPPGKYWTVEDLVASEKIELEKFFDHFEVSGTTKSRNNYTLRHLKSSYWGWQIQLPPMNDVSYNELEKALIELTGGKKIPSGGKEFIDPKGKPTLSELATIVNAYHKKGLGEIKITKVRINNLPSNLYKKAIQASLPLQEVQETKP